MKQNISNEYYICHYIKTKNKKKIINLLHILYKKKYNPISIMIIIQNFCDFLIYKISLLILNNKIIFIIYNLIYKKIKKILKKIYIIEKKIKNIEIGLIWNDIEFLIFNLII